MQGGKSNKIWDGAEDNASEANISDRVSMIRTVIRCMQPFMFSKCQRVHKNRSIMKGNEG